MSIVKKLSIATAGAALVAFGTIEKSEAVTLISDTFDAETLGNSRTNLANFTATAGNVDVLGPGGSDLQPGNGRYLDLDGQSSARLQSKTAFSLVPGNYELQFQLAGSQRLNTDRSTTNPSGENTVIVSLGSAFSQSFTLPATQSFTTFTIPFTVASSTSANLVFDHTVTPSNRQGLLLDDVLLNGPESTGGGAAVPFELSPGLGSLALVAWGVGIGLQRKLKNNPKLLSRLLLR